ncbi:MAG TPA: lactate utilization protein C [Bacillota bacterium]|nr:lactate utilization protein C [Bacillota bacterium]
MSMEKQDAFLNKIANRLGRPRRSGVRPPDWEAKPYVHLYEGKTQEDLIQQFMDNLEALNTPVDRIYRSEITSTLESVLQGFGVKSTIFWDDQVFHDLKLADHLREKGIKTVEWNTTGSPMELRREAAQVDLGIAWGDIGLAETGTVVLFNGGGRGRVVSLLPPAFLCILSEKSIVPRLTQAVQQVHSKIPDGLPSCINFITGPSRTGDIEMDLALGVHGPGKVYVILLKD